MPSSPSETRPRTTSPRLLERAAAGRLRFCRIVVAGRAPIRVREIEDGIVDGVGGVEERRVVRCDPHERMTACVSRPATEVTLGTNSAPYGTPSSRSAKVGIVAPSCAIGLRHGDIGIGIDELAPGIAQAAHVVGGDVGPNDGADGGRLDARAGGLPCPNGRFWGVEGLRLRPDNPVHGSRTVPVFDAGPLRNHAGTDGGAAVHTPALRRFGCNLAREPGFSPRRSARWHAWKNVCSVGFSRQPSIYGCRFVGPPWTWVAVDDRSPDRPSARY